MPGRRQFALAKQRKLLAQAKDIAVEKGAVPTPDGFYQYQLATSVGLLRLSFSEGYALASVFGRFDDPAQAVALLGPHKIIPFSGKWNRHWGKNDDPELLLICWKADLERLTAADSSLYLEDRKGNECRSSF